jgi:hypothetical protein
MKLGAFRIAVIVGLVLSLAGCDKCGNLDITGMTTPKTCSGAKPK